MMKFDVVIELKLEKFLEVLQMKLGLWMWEWLQRNHFIYFWDFDNNDTAVSSAYVSVLL